MKIGQQLAEVYKYWDFCSILEQKIFDSNPNRLI
jgi:hypothetical protein